MTENFEWPWNKAAAERQRQREQRSARAKKAWITRRAPKRPRGRPRLYPDIAIVRLPKGSLQRLDVALKPEETQADFIRGAIEKELQARGG